MAIQLRNPKDGKAVVLPQGTCIEITDQQGNVALLIRGDARGVVQLVTATEEPDIAVKYAQQLGVTFSRVLAPSLDRLATPPAPQPFASL